MGHLATLATCQLNQWALDWEGNTLRIIESIRQAKAAGATLRVGPELEISGYGCLDHFLEADTFLHSFEMLARIISHDDCQDILCDVGMPVRHRNVRYNARVLFLNKKILLIRPKMSLANDGNYREMRYFTPWMRPRFVEDYYLEKVVGDITGQRVVPFGDAVLSTLDSAVGAETCEELFTADPPHAHMGLNGVEIFTNSSGSHHEGSQYALRKLHTRINLITQATRLVGGIYLYANQQGCDGDRLYYDGSAMIICNGKLLAQGSQFSLNDVEVVCATVDLEEVRSFRCTPSRGMQANQQPPYQRIEADICLSRSFDDVGLAIRPTEEIEIRYHTPEEEIARSCACYLFDYLRRCPGVAGFLLPLSGGVDSCATATLVYSMSRIVVETIHEGNQMVLKDIRRIVGEPEDSTWTPKIAQDVMSRILHTVFMGSINSSKDTRTRASDLATDIGAYHVDLNIDSVVKSLTDLFTFVTKFRPQFRSSGGSTAENLALQNIQARLRMVIAYLFAQLLPTVLKRPNGGSLLVLGSANVDESLFGYLTKYDCSSADINPIGSISKLDLRRFLAYAQTNFALPILQSFIDATPTAELEPISETYVQSDEIDMGLTYEELGMMGKWRKVMKLGPWGTYQKAVSVLSDRLSPREIYEKVRRFYYNYAKSRHKMTTITPALHMEQYSPDDNRFDLRPFLYPAFSWPYQKMMEHVEAFEASEARKGKKVTKAD